MFLSLGFAHLSITNICPFSLTPPSYSFFSQSSPPHLCQIFLSSCSFRPQDSSRVLWYSMVFFLSTSLQTRLCHPVSLVFHLSLFSKTFCGILSLHLPPDKALRPVFLYILFFPPTRLSALSLWSQPSITTFCCVSKGGGFLSSTNGCPCYKMDKNSWTPWPSVPTL